MFILFISASRLFLWGTGVEDLVFDGVCDAIAIDNPLLQLQLRTRPGRNDNKWSGVVQVAALWKETNNILFRFREGGGFDRIEIDSTNVHGDVVTYTKEKNNDYPRGNFQVHTFQFAGTSGANFIRVEEIPLGLYNIQVLGFGSTFSRSAGLIGSWDRWDKRPRILLREENKLYDGFNAVKVAKSWRVRIEDGESLLASPSDVCEETFDCGIGKDIPCVEDLVGFRGDSRGDSRTIEVEECNKTCDDISNPHMRQLCQENVRKTGYTFWACQNAYDETVITESQPPACPSDCAGDSTTELFFIPELNKSHNCLWAIKQPSKKCKKR